MTFQKLEDRLFKEENINSYLEVFGNLKEPTKTVLGYTLDIGACLDEANLREEYAVFGGYGVLSHLMYKFGESTAAIWRGSTDIDMAGNERVLQAIKGTYSIISDLPSPNLKDKRTIKLTKNGEEECKIDFYLGDPKKYGESRVNTHFGIPLRVIRPDYLIKGKLMTPKYELKHCGDILGMISVLEEEGVSPSDIVKIFNHEESAELNERIQKAEKIFGKDRLGFFPGKEFIKTLKKELHRKRPVR